MKDEELLARALAGTQGAFEEIVRKYSRLVASVAVARMGRIAEIDDVLQEVFTRAWMNLARLKDPAKFSGWLYGITKWVCAEKLHDRTRRFASIDGGGSPRELPTVDRSPEDSFRRREILRTVEGLPEIYRETIMLFYFEEMRYEEIGGILGISKAAVNVRLTKARVMLRDRLSRVTREDV